MFQEFNDVEHETLLDRGFAIVEGVARKGSTEAWETVRKIDGRIYHEGKSPYGDRIQADYDDFDQWLSKQI